MKKINFALLALLALAFVGCKTPIENNLVKYTLVLKINGSEVTVKNGDTFVATTATAAPSFENELGLEGHLTTDTEMILVVDMTRNVTAGSKDALCIGRCIMGQDASGKDIPQLEYTLSDVNQALEASTHCLPGGAGDNLITYTMYPKNQPDNKLSFTVNYKK